jgi:hypothetical protein
MKELLEKPECGEIIAFVRPDYNRYSRQIKVRLVHHLGAHAAFTNRCVDFAGAEAGAGTESQAVELYGWKPEYFRRPDNPL